MATFTRFGQAQASFRPTPASIPPQGAKLVLQVPRGLPHNAHPLNPLEFLLRGATIFPDHLALAHPDVAHPVFYTYAVFAQRVQNLAYALLDAGVQPGDRVAVIAPNSPMIAEALQAAIAARVIVVTINTRLTTPEVAYILEHSAPRVVLVDHEYAHLLPKPSPFPTSTSSSQSQSELNFKIVIGHDTGREGCPYESFLSQGRRKSGEKGWAGLEMHADENAPFCLNYTSGTTGRPKGVLTTLRGTYLAAIANAYEARMTNESTYLWVLPMFHAAGWTFPWACTFAFSTQLTIRSVNYPVIWKHFLESDVTHYCGAPTVQIGIVNDPLARPLPHEIKAIIAGAAPTANLLSALEQKGIAPVHVYGLTETYGPFVRSFAHPSWKDLPLSERAALTARQGHAFATSAPARVVYPLSDEQNDSEGDVDLIDVPKDGHTVGEVVMRGNIAMAGYYRDPSATARAFRGGYFHSGDLAVWYPDGSIAIQDRSKDLIISGGENASSLAIETALAAHPDVLEVAVVGRAHEKWGERAMAFVTVRDGLVKRWTGRHKEFERELIAHARGRLPGFATPEWVVVVDELPKTSTGKILKTVLRKRAAEEAEREGATSKAKAKL